MQAIQSNIPSYTYRGCIIYKNISDKFGTCYWSIANPHLHPEGKPTRHCHCHARSPSHAERIIDCFQDLRKKKYWRMSHYSLKERNEALRLMDTYVHESY